MKTATLRVSGPLLEDGDFQLPPGFCCVSAEYNEELHAVDMAVSGPFPDEVRDGGEVGMQGMSYPHGLFFQWHWSVDRKPVGTPVVMFYTRSRSGC